MIPYGRQSIDQSDIDAVVAVLKSDFLTQGPAVPRFEQLVAERCGAAHAVAVNSATSALHIGCLALDVGPGDVVWTSPITFVASANCALYCGAEANFVDIDGSTGNMSVERLAQKLEQAEAVGRLPKVVIPVHLGGQSCDMAAIAELARRYRFRIIEDASHAVGATYRGEPVGRCRYSDIAVFSFHPVKIITSGEGGMALTNDPELARRMALLRTHGVTRDAAAFDAEPDGAWYYEQQDLGFNYRITDIQAALGASQLARLDAFVARRRELAARYDAALAGLPLIMLGEGADAVSSYHLYIIRLDSRRNSVTRDEAYDALRVRAIGVNLHYIPVYRQPYYQALGFKAAEYPEAEAYYSEAITLPLYPAMSDEQQDEVIAAVKDVLGCA